MYKLMYKPVLFLLGLLSGVSLMAQDGAGDKKVEMADAFRANGKIYVVITIVLVILLGLILYVSSLDRKIRRFEKELK